MVNIWALEEDSLGMVPFKLETVFSVDIFYPPVLPNPTEPSLKVFKIPKLYLNLSSVF
jgi:hypothetical protein